MMDRRDFLFSALSASALLATPALADRPRHRPVLSPAEMLAQARLGGAELGFVAIDLTTGLPVAEHQSGLMLPPASTLKIVTALYALDRLGAAHRFSTRVLRDGDTLVLAGGGDPTLDSDGLASLAGQVAQAAGGWRPARFAVWGGALPRVAEIAPGQAAHLAYNPAISGLILNFNRVHLGWRCETDCALSIEARASGHSPRAYTIGAGVRPGGGAYLHRIGEGREHWDIPRAGLGARGTRWLPVRQPEAYAGDVFQTLARAAGLPLPSPEVIKETPSGYEIARHDSQPLPTVLRGMLRHSTNLTAEVLGLAASGADGQVASAQRMAEWLQATGAGMARLADHSGLNAGNRISAETLARLLARPEAQSALPALLNPDPLRDVLGEASRGGGKAGAPLVQAKTGTLNFVSSLAGYASVPDRRRVAFAVLAADEARRAATEGQDWPEGSLAWVKRAKLLQRDLVAASLAPPRALRALPPEI